MARAAQKTPDHPATRRRASAAAYDLLHAMSYGTRVEVRTSQGSVVVGTVDRQLERHGRAKSAAFSVGGQRVEVGAVVSVQSA